MRLFDLRRLLFPVTAMVVIALSVVIIDQALTLVCGPNPSWLTPQFGWRYFGVFGGRIVAVEKLEQSGQLRDEQLVVALGVSTTLFGFDGPQLTSHDPKGRRWLVLGATGNSFRTLGIYSRVFLDSSLHPATVVLGLHEWMFHKEIRDLPDSSLLIYAAKYSWLFHNYKALEDWKTVFFYRGASEVRHFFHLPLAVAYEPTADPWTVDEPVYDGPRRPQQYLDIQWRGFNRYLDPAHFESSQSQVDAFTELLGALRGRGARVVCVLLPESSTFRRLYPPSASRQFAAEAKKQSLEVLDLRDSMPDDLFYDYTHLNQQGRERLSAELPLLLP
jgi:hypothetical protein